MDRPEGAVTPEELEALLDKHNKVRVYMVYPREIWDYFCKDPGRHPKYWCIGPEGVEYNLDWNGVCYGMKHWPDHHIFVNYWHFYAYELKQRRAK
jgi:hypothetical protein